MLALTAACTTELPVQTSRGPNAEFRGRYVIVGVENRVFHVRSAPAPGVEGAAIGHYRSANESVRLPASTRLVVPAVTGWALGFGDADDGLGSDQRARRQRPDEPEPGLIRWEDQRDNHYLGIAHVDVRVRSLSPTNTRVSPPARFASIDATLRLADWWRDKPWWGEVRYQLILLGCADGQDTC